MWDDLHPLHNILIITAAALLAYPVATRLSDTLRPHFEDFLDRRYDRKYNKLSGDVPAAPVDNRPDPGHLLITPAKGTEVILIADNSYLRREHGAAPGQQGTVVQATCLNPDDTGVLVDWGVAPERSVRMNLHELRLAGDPGSDPAGRDPVDAKFDAARLRLGDEQRAENGLLDPDEPTESAHRQFLADTYGPFKRNEFSPAQRAAIRAEFGPGSTRRRR